MVWLWWCGIRMQAEAHFGIPRWDPKVCTVSGNTNVNISLRMTKSSRNM